MRVLSVLLLLSLSGLVQAKVVGETLRYSVDGQEFVGYLAQDAAVSGPRPAVIVVHEWWGHNDYARHRADMLAEQGYVAMALDMYGGGKHTVEPSKAQAMMQMTVGQQGAVAKRFDAARELLAMHPGVDPGRLAAIGYCFGGAVVLNMARMGADLLGVVSFHGSLAATQTADPGVKHPRMLVFNGEADPFVKPEQVAALKDEMALVGADLEYVGYPGVQHSFTNPAADAIGEKHGLPLKYDAAADADSWARSLQFLTELFQP